MAWSAHPGTFGHAKGLGLHLVGKGWVVKDFKQSGTMQICLLGRSAGYSVRKGQEGADDERQARRTAVVQDMSEVQGPELRQQ